MMIVCFSYLDGTFLGHLSVITARLPNIHVLALTASATRHTASCIVENLGMRGPTVVRTSRNWSNIRYEAKKRSGVVEDDFSDLADELLQ